jgi:hypothetical protein
LDKIHGDEEEAVGDTGYHFLVVFPGFHYGAITIL